MRDVVARELRHRLVEGPLREPLRHEVQDHWNMLRPLLGARKPRIARELALPDHRAEPLEEVGFRPGAGVTLSWSRSLSLSRAGGSCPTMAARRRASMASAEGGLK